MTRSLYFYSDEEVRDRIRKEAMRLCEELAPYAIEIIVHDVLKNIRVFVRCR